MVEVSKKPHPSSSEEERKKMFDELGYSLRGNKRTGKLSAVQKKQPKRKK